MSPGDILTFFGYPIVDIKQEHFSFLSFTASYASDLITQKFSYYGKDKICSVFYLDSPSIQGASGSGLYITIDKGGIGMINYPATTMVGIISGTHSDGTGGKLAIVMPSYYIWELLEKI